LESKEKISFWIDDILDLFKIEPVLECEHLKEWLDIQENKTDLDELFIPNLAKKIFIEGGSWNEEELKMNFLSIVFLLANLDVEKQIKPFFERVISATVQNHQLSVKCDCMLATPKGFASPNKPYFFLQEFKKQKGDKNDPEGQMLAAMLIAQQLNGNEKPVYGAWLVGNSWWFTVLNKNQYCRSHVYDASNEIELFKIVGILRKLKEIIITKLIDR
jgi:hypothetical protein